jgi:hypothetical protein
MRFFEALVIIIAGTIMVAVQIRWALSNYPLTTMWRVCRITSSLVGGMFIGLVIGGNPFIEHNGWWMPLIGGILFWFGFTFLFPANIKHVIPPKDDFAN